MPNFKKLSLYFKGAVVGLLGALVVLAVSCAERGRPALKAPLKTVPPTATLPADAAKPNLDVSAKPAPRFLSHEDKVNNPPEVLLGQRLFRETRFSQFFYAASHGDVNAKLQTQDEIMKVIKTPTASIPNPYAGLGGINCASCHLVNEARYKIGGGMRAYADFMPRSLVPAREDGQHTTLRNAPAMIRTVDTKDENTFYHDDGEFTSLDELIKHGFSGRNFGWLPNEEAVALHQIAKVIREDDGSGELAQYYGGAYAKVLLGTDQTVSDMFRVPKEHRLDVTRASDEEIIHAVGKFISLFMATLHLSVDHDNAYDGSPYDAFLRKNNLPLKPAAGESDLAYSKRLLKAVNALKKPKFVSPTEKQFIYQNQDFLFAETELTGLKDFLQSGNKGAQGANCVSCHAAPSFTDNRFHNNGTSQEEYDHIHGASAFLNFPVPTLEQRNANPLLMEPTPEHPHSMGPFAKIPNKMSPEFADLGVWNVFANPSMPSAQKKLKQSLCEALKASYPGKSCDDQTLLEISLARFKTPTLRDLGQSAPYMHTGRFDTIDKAVKYYQTTSELAREGKIRNVDPQLKLVNIDDESAIAISAFLKSLNEDYH